MPSTFSGLEIAKRAMFAQQTALYTIGHNIANENTEGYTRQRVNMQATSPYPYPSVTNGGQVGQIGTGVMAGSIQRLRERFLDLQFRDEYKNVGEYGARADTLSKIETIINEPADEGLHYVMDEFWNGWQKLAAGNPNDGAARETLRQNAITMADNFGFIQNELKQLQGNLNENIKERAKTIQEYMDGIANYNKQINEIVPHGYVPNDLYDQRDLLLDKLSKLMDIDVSPVVVDGKDTGMVDVKMKGTDTFLVSESVASKVTAQPISSDGKPAEPGTAGNQLLANGSEKYGIFVHELKPRSISQDTNGKDIRNPPSAPDDSTTTNMLTADKGGGEIKGLLASRDEIGPKYLDRINTLAIAIVREVNAIHIRGKDKDGNDGIPFFVSKSETGKNPDGTEKKAGDKWTTPKDASDIVVNPLILNNPNKIAAGKTGQASDTSLALEMYKKKESTDVMIGGQKTSFDDYTRGIVATLGVESREAQRMLKSAVSITAQVDYRRQSLSNVSQDEELSESIKYQHAYNAAARMVTVVDEMLDKIINGMGVVGR